MVGEAGVEPAHLAVLDPKSSASANSATRPWTRHLMFNPVHANTLRQHGIPQSPPRAVSAHGKWGQLLRK